MTPPPLDGVRVVEIGRYITAPLAGMLLAELGADVIKIEPPEGDPFRVWDGPTTSPRFVAFNRGKRSAALDLRDHEQRHALEHLLADADVLIHNFRPAAARGLGLDQASLRQRFERLVVCEISGAGTAPSLDGRPMYDAIGQALSGLMSVVVTEDPTPVGPSLSDIVTGMAAAQGVLASLVGRNRQGGAPAVDVSMIGASLALVAESVCHWDATGVVPDGYTRSHQSQSYAFSCADGRSLVIHLSTPGKFWSALLDVTGAIALGADPRVATYVDRVRHYREIEATLAPVFAQRDRATWLARLRAADVPCAPLQTIEDVARSDYAAELGLIREGTDATGRSARWPAPAFHVDGMVPLTSVPALGQHTAAVLGSTGWIPR